MVEYVKGSQATAAVIDVDFSGFRSGLPRWKRLTSIRQSGSSPLTHLTGSLMPNVNDVCVAGDVSKIDGARNASEYVARSSRFFVGCQRTPIFGEVFEKSPVPE